MTKDRSFDSPLFLFSGSFLNNVNTGELLPTTARILDAMTYIISQIVNYSQGHHPDFELKTLLLKTINLHKHISSLPSASKPGLASTNDYVYESVRIVALINCRAIIYNIPFSLACQEDDNKQLFTAINRVPLTRWKSLSGIWIWVLLSMNPYARELQNGVQLRHLMRFCACSIAVREWQALVNVMEAFIALQSWIKERLAEDCGDLDLEAVKIDDALFFD
jgi:hypothetical protein